MTRILYLRDTLEVCGPGKTIVNTCRTIDRSRFALTVAATAPAARGRNRLLEALRAAGADALPIPIGRGVDLTAVWRIVGLLRSRRIHILQTHDAQTRRLGVLAAALTGVCHVTSVHGWIFNDRKERAAKWLDARLIGRAEAVIAVSDRLRVDLEAAGVRSDIISVLRNAILLRDYEAGDGGAAVRRELGLDAHAPVISIVGRLSPEKGHEVFLDAARLIGETHPAARFLVVGNGPLETSLRERARALGLESRVVFAGHRTDMAAVYGATDVLAISSFTEGIPNVLLEAFAYGKPAVATPVGGVPEVLRDGESGWLVQPGDSEALADRIRVLIDEPAERSRMGAAGRALVASRFSFEERTRILEALYERLASRGWHQHAA